VLGVQVGDAAHHQPARCPFGGEAGERDEVDLGDLGARDPPAGPGISPAAARRLRSSNAEAVTGWVWDSCTLEMPFVSIELVL